MPTLQAASPGPAEAMEAGVMSVRVEQRGAVGTVIIDRPARRNAVDGLGLRQQRQGQQGQEHHSPEPSSQTPATGTSSATASPGARTRERPAP